MTSSNLKMLRVSLGNVLILSVLVCSVVPVILHLWWQELPFDNSGLLQAKIHLDNRNILNEIPALPASHELNSTLLVVPVQDPAPVNQSTPEAPPAVKIVPTNISITSPSIPKDRPLLPPRNKSIVRIVLSAHHDDAVLSIGGMLALDPLDVTVITVFGGEPATRITTQYDLDSNFTNSHDAVTTRTSEQQLSLASLNITDMQFWGFVDGQYAEYVDANNTANRVISAKISLAKIRVQTKRAIADRIKKLLLGYTRDGIFVEVYCSFGKLIAKHRDHEILHMAVTDVAHALPLDANVTFLFYEDFPHILSHVKDHYPDLNAEWFLSYLQSNKKKVLAPKIHTFSEAQFKQKMAAIKMHKSQVQHPALNKSLESAGAFYSLRCPRYLRTSSTYCEMTWRLVRESSPRHMAFP